MALPVNSHLKLLSSAAALAWMTCCSIYDRSLLDEARDGSGGTASGGENGATGGRSGGTTGSSGGTSSGGGGGGEGSGGGCAGGDCCPDDPEKDAPGQCGCGQPDDDSDGDLTADCNDLCPDEPTKTEPGVCGCEVPEADDASCGALESGLIHRYSFAGTGTEATDSIGGRHGTLWGGAVQSGGVVTLDGKEQYVSLPAGMISSLTDATFEVWFTWSGGKNYQRVFDFGDTTGSPKTGLTYLYLAASRIDEGPGSGFSLGGNTTEIETEATATIATGVLHHVVLVADETEGAFRFYINGAFESGIAFTSSLTRINDVHGYLGRSLFEADPYFAGSIDEFRIYDVALTQAQIRFSRAQGPDTTLFD